MELDDIVGELLKTLDDLAIADNTMVMFSTDNGAASNSWPDGGNQPFHGEKGVGGFEGRFRVPMVVKWPGLIPAGTTTGGFMTMEDWVPTIMANVGETRTKNKAPHYLQSRRPQLRKRFTSMATTRPTSSRAKGKRSAKEFYYFTETVLARATARCSSWPTCSPR